MKSSLRREPDVPGDLLRDVADEAAPISTCASRELHLETYLAERNANPKPYKWKAEGTEILSKIKRGRVALDKAGAEKLYVGN